MGILDLKGRPNKKEKKKPHLGSDDKRGDQNSNPYDPNAHEPNPSIHLLASTLHHKVFPVVHLIGSPKARSSMGQSISWGWRYTKLDTGHILLSSYHLDNENREKAIWTRYAGPDSSPSDALFLISSSLTIKRTHSLPRCRLHKGCRCERIRGVVNVTRLDV